jgi:hypothetical protein
LDALLPDPSPLRELLDLEGKELAPDAESTLGDVIDGVGVPWLERCSENDGILEEIAAGRSLVHKLVREKVSPTSKA